MKRRLPCRKGLRAESAPNFRSDSCRAGFKPHYRGPAGQTGFDDVSFDLISVQYHSLKAGHDYGQYVRDARNAGRDDIADFFEQVMAQDSERAEKCHRFLRELQS